MTHLARDRPLELLASLARHCNDALLLEDSSGKIIAANDRAAEQYACPRDRLLGRAAVTLRVPEERPRLTVQRAALADAGRLVFETEHQADDGRRFRVEVSSQLVEIDGERCIHHTVRDLSNHLRDHEWQTLFFDLPFIGMAITSAETKQWISINDELCRMLGYDRPQLEAMTWAEITHPDDLEADVASFDEALAGLRDGYQLAKRFIRSDGTVMHAALDVRTVRKPNGSVDYFVATIDDITGEILARRELERSRNLYATLSGTHAAVARARDVTGLFDDVCRVAITAGGLMLAAADVVEADGRLRRIASHGVDPGSTPEAAFASQGLSLEAVRTGRLRVANELAGPNLSETWIGRVHTTGARSAAAVPVFRGGRVAAVLSLFAPEPDFFPAAVERLIGEISEGLSYALDSLQARAVADAAVAHVRELGERLRAIIDSSESPIWMRDPTGRYLVANRAFASMSGLQVEHIVGRTVDELMPPDDARLSIANDTQVLASGRSIQTERSIDTPAGRRQLLVTTSPVRNGAGKAVAVAGVAVDITERLQAETALQESESRLRTLNEDLERRIFARTEELLRAKERAEESDRLKSMFLASVSHELRTPLNSIIGFSDLLICGLAGPMTLEQEKQIGIINASGKHLLALITDFLDISKIEAGALTLEMTEIDLNAQLERDVAAYRQAAGERGLQLQLRAAGGPARVRADARRLKQIVDNLVSNAVKFTDAGRVTLTTSVTPQDVRLEVEDTGIGIEPPELQRLFEPFVRVEKRSKRPREGTGLGLAIARRLAQAMGGTIEARSRPGSGSLFAVILPRAGSR